MRGMIVVQMNKLDGDPYEKKLVDDGLFVCPLCLHAYKHRCRNCGAEKPSDEAVRAQWGKPYMYSTGFMEGV
jgi:hypothetical protein